MTAFRHLLWGLAAGMAVPGPASAAHVYALVMGVDAYAHISPLQGARNDAEDVSAALAEMGAREVRLLVDHEVTREAIFRNWSELSALAGAGDTLVFHFAGHGARQDAILDGHEAKDNLFLLAGFTEHGPGRQQRIVDNEIGHLLAIETEATVVFVADSCFAGGMTRNVDNRVAVGFRAPGITLADGGDPVTERVRALGEVGSEALRRVIWIEGQDENKVTQELAIDGKPRGALSYAFARALRGDADRNGDSRVDVPELKRFIGRTVIRLSERRQRPQVNAGASGLGIPIARRPAPVATGAADTAVPELRLFVSGERLPFPLAGVMGVVEQSTADLTYAAADRVLLSRTGDIIAEFNRFDSQGKLASHLQGAIDKWRLIELMATLASAHDPDVKLTGGDRMYRKGETVEFSITSARHRYVTLFNLAYDGTIQLIPPANPVSNGNVIGELPLGRALTDRVQVIPPFGADHLVAVTTPDALPALGEALFAVHGRREAAVLGAEMAALLQGREFGVSWVGVYTQAGTVDP